MIALYIIGGLVALVGLLLVSDIVVKVGYREEFTLTVGYGFLRFRVLPAKPKKNKQKAPKKKQTQAPSAETGTKVKSKPDLSLEELLEALGAVLRALGKIAGKTRVRPCRLWICAASPDAATTALTYGKICAGMGALKILMTELLGSFKADFRAGWDYTVERTTVQAKIVVRIRLLWIVKNGIALIWHLLIGNDAPLKGLTRPEKTE